MLTPHQVSTLSNELRQYLIELQTGKYAVIEYGRLRDRFMTCLRMRYMITAGGTQFQARCVNAWVKKARATTPMIRKN